MLELKTTSISLRGTVSVKVDGMDVPVVTMNATINETGYSSTSTTIINQQIYDQHKEDSRKDIDEFTAQVRKVEDEGIDAANLASI